MTEHVVVDNFDGIQRRTTTGDETNHGQPGEPPKARDQRSPCLEQRPCSRILSG